MQWLTDLKSSFVSNATAMAQDDAQNRVALEAVLDQLANNRAAAETSFVTSSGTAAIDEAVALATADDSYQVNLASNTARNASDVVAAANAAQGVALADAAAAYMLASAQADKDAAVNQSNGVPNWQAIYKTEIADAKLTLDRAQADADLTWIKSVAQGQQDYLTQDAADWRSSMTQEAQADDQFAHQNNAAAQAEADAIVLAAADTMVPRAQAEQAQTSADAVAAGNFRIAQANETAVIWNALAAQLGTPWAQSQAGLAAAEAAWASRAASNYEQYASELGANVVHYATSDSDQFVSEMTTIDAVDCADSDKLADAQQSLMTALASDEATFEQTGVQASAGYQVDMGQADHDYRYAMAQASHDLAISGDMAAYGNAAALASSNRTAAQAAAVGNFEALVAPAIVLQATDDADAWLTQATVSADAVLDDSLQSNQAVHDYAFAEAADLELKQKADAQALYDYQLADASGHAQAIAAFANANPSPWGDLAAAQAAAQAAQQIQDAGAQLTASNAAADAQETATRAQADAQKTNDDATAQAKHDQAITLAQSAHDAQIAHADVTDAVFALLPDLLVPPDDGTVVTLTPDFLLTYEANDFALPATHMIFGQALAEFNQGLDLAGGQPSFIGPGLSAIPDNFDPTGVVPVTMMNYGVNVVHANQAATPILTPAEQQETPETVRGGWPLSTVFRIASHTFQAAIAIAAFAAEADGESGEQSWWEWFFFGKNRSGPSEGPANGGGNSGPESTYQGAGVDDPSNRELTKINYRGAMRAGDSRAIGNQDIKNSINYGNFQIAIYEGIADALEDQIWNLATAGILGEAEAELVQVAAGKTWRFGKDIIKITIGKVVETINPDQVDQIRKVLRTAGMDDKIENVVDAVKGFSQKELKHAVGEVVEKMCFAPDTLVSTPQGQRPLRDVQIGDQVYAYDFTAGGWVLSEVLKRHDNTYSGWIYSVVIGTSRVEVTRNHPLWVVEGDELGGRNVPRDLKVGENEGQSLRGRWVNSQELRPGDVVITRNGDLLRLSAIESRFEQSFDVCNLTVRGQHTFAVGDDGPGKGDKSHY